MRKFLSFRCKTFSHKLTRDQPNDKQYCEMGLASNSDLFDIFEELLIVLKVEVFC